MPGGHATTGRGLTTTTGGGGHGIPMEMPIERPACAGAASVAPIPSKPSAIIFFVFIVSRVFGFILARLDEDGWAWASERFNWPKWVCMRGLDAKTVRMNKIVETPSDARARQLGFSFKNSG